MKKRILLIDGMYFANRALGTLNMKESSNNLETPLEINNFRAALNRQIIDLYEVFSPFIDNFVLANDFNSWRKEYAPHRPYYIPEDSDIPIGYKENRKDKKEKSSINYDNFYEIIREFIDDLKGRMIVFDIKGLEGDDVMMLLSQKVAGNNNIELIIFCTDGDISQTVKDNVMMMKNIKSKEVPAGEFVLSHNKYCEIFEQDVKSELLGSTVDLNYYKQLFAMQIYGPNNLNRSLGRGIEIATPYKIALMKSICGDKKDNIFSIISWKSSTGTMSYKLTEKHVNEALKNMGLYLTEATAKKILNSKELIIDLLNNIIKVSKQKIDVEVIGKHLKHNLKMIVLSSKNVPEYYIADFETIWNIHKDEFLNGRFDPRKLKELNVITKDSTTNLLQNSIPDITDLLKC